MLGRFAWKPLLAALHQREEHLEHVLHETERARNESEQLLAEHRRRLAAAEDQVRALIEEARKNATAAADEIVKKAQAEAEAVPQRAERDIGTARDQALSEIWSKTADLAVSVAGKVLDKSLTEDDHRRLIDAAVGELPESGRRQRPRGSRGMTDAQAPDAGRRRRPSSTRRPASWPGPTARRCSTPPQKTGRSTTCSTSSTPSTAFVRDKFPTFAEMMGSPVRTAADKDRLIAQAFEGRALPTTVNFLRVLNRHGRLDLLGPVAPRGPRDLGPPAEPPPGHRPLGRPADRRQQADALRDRLAQTVGGTPVLRLEVDPALIGGLVVQVGDDVYDASVRNRLEQLRQRLIEGKTHEIQSRRDHFSHPE